MFSIGEGYVLWHIPKYFFLWHHGKMLSFYHQNKIYDRQKWILFIFRVTSVNDWRLAFLILWREEVSYDYVSFKCLVKILIGDA